MAVSEAQKKAKRKWDKDNMTVLGIKLKKDTSDLFKSLAYKNNTTPSAILRKVVDDYIKENT